MEVPSSSQAEIRERVTAGEVIIPLRCPREIGYMDRFLSVIRGIFADCIGRRKTEDAMAKATDRSRYPRP